MAGNKTHLVPCAVPWLNNADGAGVPGAGALSRGHQNPSAEGSEGSKVKREGGTGSGIFSFADIIGWNIALLPINFS